MVTLVLMLYLSPIFGGTIHATLEYPSMELCEATVRTLVKQSIKHEILQPCGSN